MAAEDGEDVQPDELVTVKVYVPAGTPVIVVEVPEPEVVTAPGDMVTVQVPEDGRLLNGTVPVGTLHVGWVTVPTTGGEGVPGWEFTVALADEGETHPEAFVTVKVYVPCERPEMVVVDPLPDDVTLPGVRVIVHVPDAGNPLSGTLPVATVQEGWVTAPGTGGEGTGFIVTVIVVDNAHCPAEGVNVYVVVVVLFMTGLQEPVIPFKDVEGRDGIEVPAQYGPAALNDGKVLGVIVIVRLTVVAHWPAPGVNM